jgi:hypothetical protein
MSGQQTGHQQAHGEKSGAEQQDDSQGKRPSFAG